MEFLILHKIVLFCNGDAYKERATKFHKTKRRFLENIKSKRPFVRFLVIDATVVRKPGRSEPHTGDI